MEAEKDAGAEGVAGSGGAGDVFVGEFQGHLPEILAVAGAGEAAFGEVDDDEFADAGLEEGAGGVADGDGIEGAVGEAGFEAGGFAGFDFVEDTVIDVFEGGGDDAIEAVAILADDIDAGLEAGVLGFGEEGGGAGAVLFVVEVEGIEEEQVAQVEEAGFGAGEVDIGAVPEGVGAAVMEERASSAALLGHDIGVGGVGFRGGGEVFGIDVVGAAVLDDVFAEGVLSDEAGGEEGERGADLGEVEEDVVGGTACAGLLSADVGELFRGGVDVDEFDLVDDPVAAAEDAGAGGG